MITSYFLTTIFSLLFLINQESKSQDYTPLIQYLTKNKKCAYSYNGNKECLSFKRKNVFIVPHFDSLSSDIFLVSNKKEFKELINDIDLTENINKFYGQKISMDLSGLPFKKTTDTNKADLIISLTPFINLNNHKFSIIKIKEGHKIWVLKVLEDSGKNYISELSQILP